MNEFRLRSISFRVPPLGGMLGKKRLPLKAVLQTKEVPNE